MTTNSVMAALLLAVFLPGCVVTPAQKRIDGAISAASSVASADLQQIADSDEGYFRSVDEVWLSGDAIEIAKTADAVPLFLTQPAALSPQYPISLQKFAELVVQGYGVRVDVMSDAIEIASRTIDPTAALRVGDGSIAQGAQSQVGSFHLDYRHGNLSGLLDHVAARTGISWRIAGEAVQLYYRDTKTFEVRAAPGQNGVQNTVSNASGGSSGGGQQGGSNSQSSQTTTTQASLDIFATIAEALKTTLATGDSYVASPALGTVTVTATPATLDRVAEFMRVTNERMTRQVAIETKLLSVRISNGSNLGIDWDLLYRKLGSYGITASSFGESGLDTNSMAVTVLDPGSRLNGSSAIFNALSTQGNVSTVNTVPSVTMSSQPVTVQFTNSFPYVSRVQTQLVADAGAQTTIETSSIVTGLSVHLLPIVTDNQDILLQLQATLSDITELRQIGVPGGNQSLEIPAVASRDIAQRVKLRPGQTLVVSGFEQATNTRKSRGLGHANAWALGGNAESEEERFVLVLLVTPKIL